MRRVGLGIAILAAALVAALLATCDRTDRSAPAGEAPPAERVESVKRRSRFAGGGDPEEPAALDARPSDSPSDEGRRSADVTLAGYRGKIAAPKHLLRGRVVDTQGKPLVGCRVELLSAWLPSDVIDESVHWPPAAEATIATDADGRFELPYWEGGLRELRVSDPEGTARWRGREVGDDREVEIVLPARNADVVVRTVSATDGAPVTVRHVTIFSMPVYEMQGVFDEVLGEQSSDECRASKGVHRFPDVPAGPAVLEVDVDGYAPVRRWIDVSGSGEQTIGVELAVGRTLHGRVVDAVTGATIANACIQRGDYFDHAVQTDSEGRFALEHAPVAPRQFRTFRAVARGYADEQFVADGTDGAEFVVKLQRNAALRARCVDPGGAPLAHVVVSASSDFDASAPGGMRTTLSSSHANETEADGRIEIGSLHPGTEGLELRVRFFLDGVPVLDRSFPPLRPGETRDLGDVVLAPTLTLRGTVLDADGKPVAGATVVAAPNDTADEHHAALGAAVMERGGRRAESGPDGAFTLMGLSKGLWDLYAYASWESPGRLEPGVDPARGTVTLRLPRVVALTGRVLDASGAPVAKANVASYRAFFGMRMSVSCLSTADGTFGIPGYAEGTPEVEVAVTPREGADAQEFKARPGAAGTELRLR